MSDDTEDAEVTASRYGRTWAEDEVREPYPAPLVEQRPADPDEIPAAAALLGRLCAEHGWSAEFAYAVGNVPTAQWRPGRLAESVLVRMRGPRQDAETPGRWYREAACITYWRTYGKAGASWSIAPWSPHEWFVDESDRPTDAPTASSHGDITNTIRGT